MAEIKPFKAIRPTRDKVHLVATRPFYTYKKNVLNAKLESNPYTFLHIINPEFGSKVKTRPNSTKRFQLVAQRYTEFLSEDILKQDQEAHFYIYRQSSATASYTGIIAGVSVEEYKQDKIKKHEATLTAREEMFVNYLDVVGYNAEPVLLSYAGNDHIHAILDKLTKERAEYEFTTTDKITHELWIVPQEVGNRLKEEFEKIEALYIADGHHRSASSVGLYDKRRNNQEHFPNESSFLAYLLDEKDLLILEFNRLVNSLNELSAADFLNALGKNFELTPLTAARKPTREHEITMCLQGKWYSLSCKASIIDKNHPVNSLDAEILTQYVLTPILGIENLKASDNVDFSPGNEPLEKIEQLIEKGKYQIGFFLYPVNFEQVKKVANNQMIMPPKSTWVEPKLRSGLTIYKINE